MSEQTPPTDPQALVDWALEQSDIQDQQAKEQTKKNLHAILSAVPNFLSTFSRDELKGVVNAMGSLASPVKSAGSSIQQRWTQDAAKNNADAAMDNAKIAEKAYKASPTAKNTKKWLETQAWLKHEVDNYQAVIGQPYKKNLTFAPEVLAYIETKKNGSTAKAQQQVVANQETARENRRVSPVVQSTPEQAAAETARENRRAGSVPIGTGTPPPGKINADAAAIISGLKSSFPGLAPDVLASIASNISGGGGGSSTPTTQKSVQQFSGENIQALFNQVAPSVLGRMLDQKTIDQLGKELNAAAMKQPSITKTKISGGTSITETQAGFNESAYAQKTLQDTAEGQAFAADKVFRSAMQVLADRIG